MEKNEWISVKDNLPEKGQQVLTWHYWGYAISFRGVEDEFVDPNIDMRWNTQPTHWQHLPEKPKEYLNNPE